MKEVEVPSDYAEQAKADFDRALSLNPNLIDVQINYGLLEIYTGDYDKAIDRYTKLLKLEKNKRNYAIHANLVEAYIRKEEYDKAEELLQKYESKETYKVYAYLAATYLKKGRQLLNKVNGNVQKNTTPIKEAKQWYEKAIKYYDKAIQLGVQDETYKDEIYIGLASSYSEMAMALLLEGGVELEPVEKYIDMLKKTIETESFPKQEHWKFRDFLLSLPQNIVNLTGPSS